jgi:hypothetical protein
MKHIIVFTFIAMTTLLACDKLKTKKNEDIMLKSPGASTDVVADTTMAYEMIPDAQTSPPPPKQEPGEPNRTKEKELPSKQPESKPDWNKKIIKTADLNIETKSYPLFTKKVNETANRFGGYIAEEQQTETEYKIENVVTIKVPVDQFQSAVDYLSIGDGKINEKKITSEDVTSQYVDTKSRLEAKRVARLRYLELLKQSKNMEEILQVQREIDDIQEEIESAVGRINYLVNASAMSTIHITYYQVLDVAAKEVENPGFFKEVGNAIVTGWRGVGEVIVGLAYIWPLLLVVVGVIWYLRKTVFAKKAVIVKE